MRLRDIAWKDNNISMNELILLGIKPLENMADMLITHIRYEFEEENGANEPEIEKLVFIANDLSLKINELKDTLERLDRERRGIPRIDEVEAVRYLLKIDEDEGPLNQKILVSLVKQNGERWAVEHRDSVLNDARINFKA